MSVSRNKTVTETVIFTLKDMPGDNYIFLEACAVATIVDGEVDEVKIHLGDHTYDIDTGYIEWLTALAGLANGLLEELKKEQPDPFHERYIWDENKATESQ